MTTTNTTEIESIRAFAVSHGEIQFAHLCTAALAGEQWAVFRVEDVIMLCDGLSTDDTLDVIRATDTTRPEGTVPRSLSAPV